MWKVSRNGTSPVYERPLDQIIIWPRLICGLDKTDAPSQGLEHGLGCRRASRAAPESLVNSFRAAAAAAFCLVLFWLAYRATRRLVDLAIARGHAEEQRRLAEEHTE